MKFLKVEEMHGAEYAIFELESTKEQDFFYNISPIKENSSFDKLPDFIQSWLLDTSPPAILSEENSIMLIIKNSHSFRMFSKSIQLFDFLDYLFKKDLIENNASESLRQCLEPSKNTLTLS